MKSFLLPRHNIDIKESRIISCLFDDGFYSKGGAEEEVDHVFIHGNNLEERWLHKGNFTIGELGFGLGISFCRIAEKWALAKKNSEDVLHYFSVEGFPLNKDTIKEFHIKRNAPNGQLAKESQEVRNQLIPMYPALVGGTHRLVFEKERILLTIAFLPVIEALEAHDFKADAWLLDGFSPSRNPEMWSSDIFQKLYSKTKIDGTFSTYSASSLVKKNSSAAGFTIKTLKGFGSKREMLSGIKLSSEVFSIKVAASKPKVAIIGGGLAGAAVYHSLQSRNVEAHLFEREASLSCGASANLAAVIMPHLSSVPDYLCRYFLAGYLHTLRLLEMLGQVEELESYSQTGVIRMANVNKWSTICSRIDQLGLNEIVRLVQGEELSLLLGLSGTSLANTPALLFPHGGSIRPSELVTRLTKDMPASRLHLKTEILAIESTESVAKAVLNNGTTLEFDYIIFTNAYDAAFLNDINWLPIEKIKGQLFVTEIDRTLMPKAPLCYDGYAIPLSETELLIGATYEHNAHENEFNREVVDDLSLRLRAYLPELPEEITPVSGRSCFRTTSPDRMPVVGMIPRRDGSETRYYSSLGHGSRGTISCLLAAEILASQILQEPSPVEADLLSQLAPERFLEREKRRGISLEKMYSASYLWREQDEGSLK